jgi:hypothetical protein
VPHIPVSSARAYAKNELYACCFFMLTVLPEG